MLSGLDSFHEGVDSLLVGHDHADDAAVVRLGDGQLLVQTVDFFTPIVDDPETFGAIAAANAVSDVYAMGARPIVALAIAAFPVDVLPNEVLEAILRGGAAKAQEAGFPVAGGHTIIDDIPKYGLAVTGLVSEEKLLRNSTAKEGDLIYLTKPIGNGILISAHRALGMGVSGLLKRERPSLDEAIKWMLTLNDKSAAIASELRATAATDVTGYGLIGHLMEMCRGADLSAAIDVSAVPALERSRELLANGYRPEGSGRNAETHRLNVNNNGSEDDYLFLCDAQTSGGLIFSIPESNAASLEKRFDESGLLLAKIGRFESGPAKIRISRSAN